MDKIRPFLKWPGGKYRIIHNINAMLPKGDCLIEPFVGSGAIFLNSNYKEYKLNDLNPDLINIFKQLKKGKKTFIAICKDLFKPKLNSENKYYQLRNRFNLSPYNIERASLFLYLNRHGYNGLCRYNKKQGWYNVPFGRYKKPYFPEEEMQIFYQKAKHAKFSCLDYKEVLKSASKGDIVYCDPPYAPLSSTANFTQYCGLGFNAKEQQQLAEYAKKISIKGVRLLLSNHDTNFTREIYSQATKIFSFKVRRNISCKTKKRLLVPELLAYFVS